MSPITTGRREAFFVNVGGHQCMIGEMFDQAGEQTKDPKMARAMIVMIDEVCIVAQCTGNEIWSEKLH